MVIWLHGMAAARANQLDPAIHDMEVMMSLVAATRSDSTDDVPLAANEFRYVMAALHQKAGRMARAVELYHAVATADLGNFMAHVQLARIHEAARDFQQALAERQRAVESNPDDPVLPMDLGVTLGKAGQFELAARKFQEALDANPRDVRPLFWLGIADQQLGRKDEAKAAFQRYVALAPSRYDRQIAMARDRLTQLQ